MSKPRALDLFCKQGGASAGLVRAGFDVTGVDIDRQPRYPYNFIQANALTFPLDGYDFYWASPPCQPFTRLHSLVQRHYPDLLAAIRRRLDATGKPYVIENVPGAPLLNPLLLCGTMFGLQVRRHRLFECFPPTYPLLPPHACKGKAGYTNAYHGISSFAHGAKLLCVTGHNFHVAEASTAMGIDWMTADGLREAVPPIMATFIANTFDHYRAARLASACHSSKPNN